MKPAIVIWVMVDMLAVIGKILFMKRAAKRCLSVRLFCLIIDEVVSAFWKNGRDQLPFYIRPPRSNNVHIPFRAGFVVNESKNCSKELAIMSPTRRPAYSLLGTY